MKLRKLIFTLAALVLFCTAVCAGDYSDVPDTHWAREQIEYLSGEIAGYPDGTFRPEAAVTRAEFVTLLARIAFPEELKNETGDTWWEAAYRVCEANNLLSGTDGYGEAMPRGEIAQMLGTLCRGWGGVNARADAGMQADINWKEQRMESPETAPLFSDTQGLDDDRYLICANQGLMTGYPDGTFRPDKGVTRAEAAAILSRLKAQLAFRASGVQYICTVGEYWLMQYDTSVSTGLSLYSPLAGTAHEMISFWGKGQTPATPIPTGNLLTGADGTYVWGRAGLYRRSGSTLEQITFEPVLDFCWDGDTLYYLSWDSRQTPTYLCAAVYFPCATEVMMQQKIDGNTAYTELARRDEDSNMQNLTDIYVQDGKVYVAGTYCMGMMDVHCALYEVADGKLTALFGES